MKQYKINCKNFRELRFLNHAPKAKQSPDLLKNIKVAIKFLIYFAIFFIFLSQVNIYCTVFFRIVFEAYVVDLNSANIHF